MTYEARHSRPLNFALAAAVLLLSILGFAVAGIIPTQSGSNPAVGWAIVVACIAAAGLFVHRALDDDVQARIDARGVWSRRRGADPVPWSEISGFHVLRAGIQRIGRFELRGGGTFGINTTFYDRGINELVEAVRQAKPDFAA